MRQQIWAGLSNFKFKSYCLSYVVQQFQNRERSINIVLAIASSGSIAAWAIWNQFPLVWSSIICTSQVITAVRPYFPYSKYVKELNAKCMKLGILNIEFEKLWYKFQNNKISEEQASEIYFELKHQASEILSFQDDTLFKVSKEIEDKSNKQMKNFFKSQYNIDIDIK